MDFITQEIYDKEPIANKDKTIVSKDAYAISTMIDMLIKKIEQTRVTLV